MIFQLHFRVLISGLSVILFGLLTVAYLHFLRRQMKVIPSFVISLALSTLSILSLYRFNLGLWYEHAQIVYTALLQDLEGVWSILTIILITPPLIGSASMVSEKLSRRNFRSCYHLIYGVIIVSLLWLNHGLAFFALSMTISLFVIGEYLRFIRDRNILTSTIRKSMDGAMKGEEIRGMSSSLFYILGAMIVIIFLDKQLALASILILAIGDTSVAQIGEKIGQHKFNFNPKKTLEGSITMFLVCFITLQLIGINLIPTIFVAFSATLFESLDVEISDNLLLPLITGMILLVV